MSMFNTATTSPTPTGGVEALHAAEQDEQSLHVLIPKHKKPTQLSA